MRSAGNARAGAEQNEDKLFALKNTGKPSIIFAMFTLIFVCSCKKQGQK
jgi:hypothetical protein